MLSSVLSVSLQWISRLVYIATISCNPEFISYENNGVTRGGKLRTGFHAYQDIWTPATGEHFSCQAEDSNSFDPYAVAIRRVADVSGHVPHKISAACSLFVQRGGTLTCIITDCRRQYSADLSQGGLQIPCKLEFKCDDADLLSIVKKLVRSASPIDFELKHHAQSVVSVSKREI